MKLYRFDIFIAEKALKENKSQGDIVNELCDYLGMTWEGFRVIRNAETGPNARITHRLLHISSFFNCTMNDLVNPQALEIIAQENK